MIDRQKAEHTVSEIKQGNRQAAAKNIAELLAGDALLGEMWGAMARLALSIGELDLCKQAAIRYANINKRDITRQVKVAGIMAEAGLHEDALSFALAVESAGQVTPALTHLIGTLYQQMGINDKAERYLRRTLDTWPTAGETWLTLAAGKVFSESDSDIVTLENLVKTPLNARSMATAQYALGKAYLDVGNNKLAFDTFSRGAHVMKSLDSFDAEREQRSVESIINSFSSWDMAKLGESKLTKNHPIFVLGLPRSGTTLMEHILCGHSQVLGGGELGLVPKVLMEMKGGTLESALAFQERFEKPGHAWEYLSATYQYMVSQRFGDYGMVVDKSLNNSRYLGLVAKMFPSSPMILMKRNVLDVAWSCFRTCFSGSMPWSWDFKDIARFFQLEERLFKHWQEVLGERLLVVNYEDLVTSPEETTNSVLKHCRLPFEPVTQNFHKSQRVVTTSSTAQVRAPLHRESLASSMAVAEQIQAFKGHFGDLT